MLCSDSYMVGLWNSHKIFQNLNCEIYIKTVVLVLYLVKSLPEILIYLHAMT